MIRNYAEYREYVEEDMHHVFSRKPSITERMKSPTWRYQHLLRRCEWIRNTRRFPCLTNLFYFFNKFRLRRMGIRLGFSISENTCGKGLSLPHYGSIIIHPDCRIGENCRIHAGVNIGSDARGDGVPRIGNNVYIGPGAKIFGGISIGDNCAIGANAVVNRSFPDGVTLGGVPARVISENDSAGIIRRYEW